MVEEETIHVTADFSKSIYEALKSLAEEKNVSMAQALADSIALSKWLQERVGIGKKRRGRIWVEYGGKTFEIRDY